MPDRSAQPTVLVVDDDEDTLELLGEYLSARGMQVLTAYAAEEAVALVRSMSVDAVLTRVGEGSAGLELVHASRALARPAGVVVTLVRESVPIAVSAMKSGASDVLCKPYRLKEVYEALQRALAQRTELLSQRAAAERLLFYEAAAELTEWSEVFRLWGLLAQVARRACSASEVAVWQPGAAGWSAMARGGTVDELGDVDPAELVMDGPFLGASIAAHPMRDSNSDLLGVLAVAGGTPRHADHLQHMGRLCRVVVDAMERVSAHSA
jgi:DNA-binding response OmpR family regulator